MVVLLSVWARVWARVRLAREHRLMMERAVNAAAAARGPVRLRQQGQAGEWCVESGGATGGALPVRHEVKGAEGARRGTPPAGRRR